MKFKIFTLHPTLFNSFFSESLVKRAHDNDLFDYKLIDWRQEYGIGNYKQVDDKPFGGGSGMVLQPEPIFQAMKANNSISNLYSESQNEVQFNKIIPNNSKFYTNWLDNRETTKRVTISLTPKGFTYNQEIAEWLTNFNEVNILCGRYEGFDSRVDSLVDLEISLGDFVINGGEVASMVVLESLIRQLPGFTSNDEAIAHDSFSSSLNHHKEQNEFVVGKNNLKKSKVVQPNIIKKQIFDDSDWKLDKLPNIEHPQFTRPSVWKNLETPSILLSGNHKKISKWRINWFK